MPIPSGKKCNEIATVETVLPPCSLTRSRFGVQRIENGFGPHNNSVLPAQALSLPESEEKCRWRQIVAAP